MGNCERVIGRVWGSSDCVTKESHSKGNTHRPRPKAWNSCFLRVCQKLGWASYQLPRETADLRSMSSWKSLVYEELEEGQSVGRPPEQGKDEMRSDRRATYATGWNWLLLWNAQKKLMWRTAMIGFLVWGGHCADAIDAAPNFEGPGHLVETFRQVTWCRVVLQQRSVEAQTSARENQGSLHLYSIWVLKWLRIHRAGAKMVESSSTLQTHDIVCKDMDA